MFLIYKAVSSDDNWPNHRVMCNLTVGSFAFLVLSQTSSPCLPHSTHWYSPSTSKCLTCLDQSFSSFFSVWLYQCNLPVLITSVMLSIPNLLFNSSLIWTSFTMFSIPQPLHIFIFNSPGFTIGKHCTSHTWQVCTITCTSSTTSTHSFLEMWQHSGQGPSNPPSFPHCPSFWQIPEDSDMEGSVKVAVTS